MGLLSSSSNSQPKGITITVPVLVLALSASAIFLFFLLSSLSTPCSCPTPSVSATYREPSGRSEERVSTTTEDISWVKDQIRINGLHMQDNVLRKGINPRTRVQQLEDLRQYTLSHTLIYVFF